jgi:hypothetical protein
MSIPAALVGGNIDDVATLRFFGVPHGVHRDA